MNEHLLSILYNYGLAPKEAKIYLVLLELGQTGAAVIARRTDIKRVTVYALLKSMIEKGMIYTLVQQGKNQYIPIPPNKLLLKKKRELATLENALPDFINIAQDWTQSSQITVYAGREQMKNAFWEILDSKTPTYSFLGREKIDEKLECYMIENFIPQRVKRSIFSKTLVSKGIENEAYSGYDAQAHRETRVVNHPLFKMKNEITLYGPGVVLIILWDPSDLRIYKITNMSLYEMLLSLFDYIRSTC